MQLVGRRRAEYEADVEFAVEQTFELGPRAPFPQMGDQPGVGGVQSHQGWPQYAMTGREVVADVDRAGTPGGCVAGGLHCFAGLLEYLFCLGLEGHSRRSEPDFVGGTGDQFDTDFTLEALQVLTQRWLGEVKLVRRPAKVQLIRDGQKRYQMSKLH